MMQTTTTTTTSAFSLLAGVVLCLLASSSVSEAFASPPSAAASRQSTSTTAKYIYFAAAAFSTSDDKDKDDGDENYPSFSPQDYNQGMMMEDDENDDDEERLTDEELMATISDWDPTVPTMNTVHLTGRVGNDPVPKYFEDGKVVVNLSLATKRKYHYQERQFLDVRSGEEETDWYGLEIWGQTAEYVSRFVDKGMQVGVIGSLQENRWTDKETGETRNQYRIIVRDFDILETRAASELRRRSSSSSSGGNNYYNNNNNNNNNSRRRGSGSSFSTSDDDDDSYGDGPSSAGTGGFFDM